MKYRIEIERISDGPRPWEWRIYHAEDGKPFSDEPDVTGSKPTAQRALEEADITLGLMTPEERQGFAQVSNGGRTIVIPPAVVAKAKRLGHDLREIARMEQLSQRLGHTSWCVAYLNMPDEMIQELGIFDHAQT